MSITHHRNSCKNQNVRNDDHHETNVDKKESNHREHAKVYEDSAVSINSEITCDDQNVVPLLDCLEASDSNHCFETPSSNFDSPEAVTANDDSDFQMVSKKTKKNRNTKKTENLVLKAVPKKWKPKNHNNIILNFSTLETELNILRSKQFSFMGDSYPENNIYVRYLSKHLLKQVREKMSEWSVQQINKTLNEAERSGVKLTWFLYDDKIYYFID